MTFEIKGNQFYKNGKQIKIISGAVHYFRNLPGTWRDIFKKMRAMGCNCVETYCAWTLHEKKKGEFDFSGILDIEKFLKTAQEEGLMAIVRPGPYICAEFEFGGLPWWIQSEEDIEIRCMNASYIKYFDRYLDELLKRIKPLLCTNGGNVIMMQCENEYGYYGDDKKYLKYLHDGYRKRGIDVPLFTSDGTSRQDLLDGTTEGCLPTLNFGSRVEENFAEHDKMFPCVPKMCMEMWDGWFDAWGDEKHHTTDAKAYAKVVDDMLARGSVNFYMFIGGTNFGFTSGANHYETYAPDVTSYDYDALLSECGDVTEKYLEVRKVIQKHTGEDLPPVPENRPKAAYGKVKLNESASLFANLENLSKVQYSSVPRAMETYGSGYGYILYRTRLNRDYENVRLSFSEIGDRAQVYINDELKGIVYVNDKEYSVTFSAKEGDALSILCENMGRTNFGPKSMRKKGLPGRCLLDTRIHFDWEVYTLPMDNLGKTDFSLVGTKENSRFYKGKFTVENPLDTFLKTDNFRKGFVVINGFNLGRFWEIGPQKTLFVPAGILRDGENEIILFESDGIKGLPEVEFTDKPELG